MALAVVFKNVLHVPPEQSFIPMISPAILFVVYTSSKNSKCRCNAANIWMGMILLVTLAIILVYAL
ncbi:MAG: hypothetical protein A7315_12580 [Candidatus Altiarchaeales archaeon WOR_SM1_79]|nr:MAG: hypothetical protein A7315_12580 [Candidatus Altiarchaeales archaeon WOR_SM1_79]